ncbi:1-deoxy-D-xylulose-5-phosphate synthase [Alloalcanivorax sp. C16-2]|uniref:1-deoxy-D-xylulose-5-phosphate synthase n=1 Tax=Alloalcanivorax TaxID=3020832 RepID=UPI001933583F|nr:1-deoxy-D-xylulose-5-phosphate synthase [Alloalcanivorax marinus]MBL7250470.1 1-deoxy-D-xylulose-5-phosphate synthase [Alloalcanivorax marinus]
MPKTFTDIPLTRPRTPLLDDVLAPADLRRLPEAELERLADELRAYLLYAVGRSGGHFGAGLGVVELTVALHYLFDTPHDRLVWDVGHQCYPHKILTGRRDDLLKVRQQDGPSGFPNRAESEYDTFGVGHSSTSISAALGMALGAENAGEKRRTVAVIGDGAMTAGQAFEALSHAAHTRANLLVVLNDNTMSIGHNVGGLANYFARIWASKTYIALREGGKKVLSAMPAAWDFVRRTEESMKNMVSPDMLFEAIGFNYIGPIDGHDLDELTATLATMRDLEGPQLLHVYTTKGKGFGPAEADPVGYHAINKIEPKPKVTPAKPAAPAAGPKYQQVFGDWLCDLAERDQRLIGITPAMCEGSGMVDFARRFPDRYHDVAICEQHAVTLAGGMACEGRKPVVAIYSTFLQRAYDQLIHDVALQNLDVTFGLDRAGLVGEDGATHGGVFDLAYLRTVPNMIVAAPSDENECRQLLYTAWLHQGPAAVRYPRGTGPGATIQREMTPLPIGKSRTLRQGKGPVALLAFGALVPAALKAAEKLDATVIDMRWVKPLDREAVLDAAGQHGLLVTLEDHQRMGGAGSAVNELVLEEGLAVPVLNLGLPDHFIHHGKREDLLAQHGLDADGIEASVRERLKRLDTALPHRA